MFADKANMRPRAATLGLLVLLAAALPVSAQRSASSALAVQVNPEATVSPQVLSLQFTVSSDGSSDVVSQTAIAAASVRAGTGQAIHFTATLTSLTGPAGSATPAALTWSGSATQATGGARQASCTSGSFSGSAPQDLAQGWGQSGSLQCQVTFHLAQPRSLAPGTYSAMVTLQSGS